MSLDLIPMLLLSLLLLTTGHDVQSAQIVFTGDHSIENTTEALVVSAGTVTVPAGATLSGPLHILGGDVVIAGHVDGDVVQLGGTLALDETASIAGTLHHDGGQLTRASGATVASVSSIETAAVTSDPRRDLLFTAVMGALLALVGAWAARRSPPRALGNVADAIRHHPVVSVCAGVLLALTATAVLVFMAFTVLLLPVALIGLALGLAVLGYATLGLGHLVGRLLPIRRPALRTAAGILIAVAGLRALQLVPVVGDPLALALLLTSLGAVIITYLGLRHYTLPALPG